MSPPRRVLAAEMKEYKLAAMSKEQVKKIYTEALKLKPGTEVSPELAAILILIEKVNAKTQAIQSCDSPFDTKPHETAALVMVVQRYSSVIMNDRERIKEMSKSTYDSIVKQLQKEKFDLENATQFERIQKVAEISFRHKSGNCMEKSLYAFCELLDELTKLSINTPHKSIVLELNYFHNHYVLMVNHNIVMDPWLNLYFMFKNESDILKVYQGFGDPFPFFTIDHQWLCSKNLSGFNLELDLASSARVFENYFHVAHPLIDKPAEKETKLPIPSAPPPPPPGFETFMQASTSSSSSSSSGPLPSSPSPPPGFESFMRSSSSSSSTGIPKAEDGKKEEDKKEEGKKLTYEPERTQKTITKAKAKAEAKFFSKSNSKQRKKRLKNLKNTPDLPPPGRR